MNFSGKYKLLKSVKLFLDHLLKSFIFIHFLCSLLWSLLFVVVVVLLLCEQLLKSRLLITLCS